jgi:5-(aminomethyl)-3-furanmethanol phosphate kinase
MTKATVVKVGGSLAESDAAAELMRSLAARRPPRLVVVPGGGDFADAVRLAGRRQPIGDQAAHHMALLAMHMSAVMLGALAAGYVVAESAADFEAAWRRDLTPVWAPERMVLAAPEVPASWDVTSDSLAAWLARVIAASRLLLVKACPVPGSMDGDAAALAAAGIVDPMFPRFVADVNLPWRVVSGVGAALQVLGV